MDSTVTAGVLGGIATIVGTLSAAFIGRWRGSLGKTKGFEKLQTELALDQTRWKGEYVQVDFAGTPDSFGGVVEFRQYGSRITGEAVDMDGRKWLLEGLAYKGRLCYVYVDDDPNITSIGTASYELTAPGKLTGKWTGWTPDGAAAEPQRITLTKV